MALLLLACRLGAAEHPPAALRALLEARKSISGVIEWQLMPEGDERRALNYVSRYAKNGDMIFENRGDHEGWTVFDTTTMKGYKRYPQLYLINRDGLWHFEETKLDVMLWKMKDAPDIAVKGDVRDIRGVGISITARTLKDDIALSALWAEPADPVVSWRQEAVGDLFVVTAKTREGAEIVWHINPKKGWNAERILFDQYGYRAEVHCKLTRYGDVWLPEITDYIQNGRVTESVRIRSARLNQEDGPRRFTPTDMGVEPGSRIARQNFGDPAERLVWNGETIATYAEWEADVRSGRRQWGPIHARLRRGEPYHSPYETEEEREMMRIARRQMAARYEVHMESGGLWRQYVEDFIRRYELTPAQADEARQILERCEKEAARIVEKIRPELEALVLQRLNARAAGDEQAMQEANDRIAELRQPLDRIFEEDLKPRLERLPTRAQRKKAEASAAATQPASGPGP